MCACAVRVYVSVSVSVCVCAYVSDMVASTNASKNLSVMSISGFLNSTAQTDKTLPLSLSLSLTHTRDAQEASINVLEDGGLNLCSPPYCSRWQQQGGGGGCCKKGVTLNVAEVKIIFTPQSFSLFVV